MAEEVTLPTYETLLTEAIRSLAIDSGTVTVSPPAGVAVLQDDTKNWPTDVHRGRLVKVIRGAGAGQLRIVLSNSDKLLTLNQAWTVPPGAGSVYVILGEDFAVALLNMNLRQWGGTALTGRDISLDLANLDIALSAFRDALRGAATKDFSTLEADAESILAQLDITLSALKAVGAETPRTLSNLYDQMAATLARNTAQWGSTTLTGRDISLDLKALTDDSIKGLLKSIGDIAALENLITRIGQTTDAIVAAGAAGSVSAKLRRVTQGLEDLKALIALSQLPASLTIAGNLKISVEEQAIALGIDVQARYNLRTLRTISTPTIDTDYFLPETGSIDLSNFIHSTFFAYAPTTATMVISACELQVSLDGGSVFRKASGYEIADTDFIRDEFNSIDVPLMLAPARFRIRFGTAAPASAELAVIRKA